MPTTKATQTNRVFTVIIYAVVLLITATCVLPILNLLALSFSDSQAIIENKVTIFPVNFTLKAYRYVMDNEKFWTACLVSFKRVLLGVPLNVILTILVAYPLSKSDQAFPQRKRYVRLMLFVMLFNGGLMPTYFVISKTGLIDTIWSLLIPGAVPVMSCILMLNFFRGIPGEIEESAMLDGASPLQILTKIYLPLSKPSIATVTLFALIGHWNSWFEGLIYFNHTYKYPLQSYLQTLVTSTTELINSSDLDQIMALMSVNDTNLKSAQIFISIVPLMVVYPFLQKYFTTGLTLGSVKG